MNNYEAIIILPDNIEEKKVEEKIEKLKARMTASGAENTGFTRLGRRIFARPLNKRSSGFYVLAHFSAESERLPQLHETLNMLKRDGDVFRFQILCERGKAGAGKSAPAQEDAKEAAKTAAS